MSKQTDLINIPDAITVSGSNVGIGTSNPSQILHVGSTTSYPTGIGLSNSERYYAIRSHNYSLVFTDATVGQERMRIDSSGNLLVGGHTSTHSPVENGGSGVSLLSNGQILAGGEYPSYFNRENSDGDIINLRKDGSTVGSIGTNGGVPYITCAIGGGVKFSYSDSTHAVIFPVTTTGAIADNAHDLGYANARFRDAYLSGGVYLGGNGSANKLEDYEEGTWTAVDGSGNAYNSQGIIATYTKIGRIVYINFDVTATASTSGYQIAGLPFTASPNSVTGNWSVYGGYSTSNADIWGHINQNSTAIGMYVGSGGHTLNGRWIGAGFYYTEQ